VLSSRNLAKHFDGVVAADQVSVEIAAGERVGLIGSNGAGKTTFVNMITGYLKPDAGAIELEGRDITALGPRAIMRLGVARSFQIPQLCAEMSVLDNMLVAAACGDGGLSWWRPACGDRELSFFRSAHTEEKVALALKLLETFDLAEHAQRRVGELPGGVRKLLDIALAMTGRPKLLLLDEPTSGVSVEEKFPLMDTVMGALGSETVLFVEHDMEVVSRYASRVIAFYSGRVLADGAPDAVLADENVRRHVTGHA
jgi:branched-chain amino acid transport system ATP-binding protein